MNIKLKPIPFDVELRIGKNSYIFDIHPFGSMGELNETKLEDSLRVIWQQHLKFA